MDENIYEVEFKLPKEVEKQFRGIGKDLAIALNDAMEVLFPDYEIENTDEAIQTVLAYIMPVVMEEVTNTIIEIMEKGS